MQMGLQMLSQRRPWERLISTHHQQRPASSSKPTHTRARCTTLRPFKLSTPFRLWSLPRAKCPAPLPTRHRYTLRQIPHPGDRPRAQPTAQSPTQLVRPLLNQRHKAHSLPPTSLTSHSLPPISLTSRSTSPPIRIRQQIPPWPSLWQASASRQELSVQGFRPKLSSSRL